MVLLLPNWFISNNNLYSTVFRPFVDLQLIFIGNMLITYVTLKVKISLNYSIVTEERIFLS